MMLSRVKPLCWAVMGLAVEHRTVMGGGFVPMQSLVGRAILVSWPLERWAWLDDFESTFVGVEPQGAAELGPVSAGAVPAA